MLQARSPTVPESEPREVFLEVEAAATPPAPAATASAAPWLELDDHAPEAAEGTQRRKVRAVDRGPSVSDQESHAIVVGLVSGKPLLAALWPSEAPAELLRSPPPEATLHTRCDYARRAIDAVARRDAAARAQAEVAQRALQTRLDALGPESSRTEAALAELRRAQVADLEAMLPVLVGAPRALTAMEFEQFARAAEQRGLEVETARGVVRDRGYGLPAAGLGGWAPLAALPGAPTTMDAAAASLLQHPAQGYEAVRSGAIFAWLREQQASSEVQERAREARQMAERGNAEALAVHVQAWALGLRVLVLGTTWLRSPGEIATKVREGQIVLDDLSRAAREGTLGRWLRELGWVPAAGAADLVARGEPSGLKRLAWSLGEPLVLGGVAVTDPDTLARTVIAQPEARDALGPLHASGDLLAWLESLPSVLRDARWLERCRRARADDLLPVWQGIYERAQSTALTLIDRGGAPVLLSSTAPLRLTAQVAELWDVLKRSLRTGELIAWLEAVAPGLALPTLPRPPRDEDGELNALLWAVGHRGLVLEWGASDLAVGTPEDLIRAYERSWQQFEAQVARGYPLEWLERFHGGHNVLPAAPGAAAVALQDALAWVRGEAARLPAGHLALKVALLCGMRHLPLDPTEPGDRATFRGYTHVSGGAGSRGRWEPLRNQAASGTAVLWVALSNVTDAVTARSLFHHAFIAPAQSRGAQHPDEVIGMLARSFGDPIPSPALGVDLAGAIALRSTASPIAAPSPTAARAPRSLTARLALWAALAVAAASFYFGWSARANDEPAEPAAAAGSEIWVQIQVRMEADSTRLGRRWDLDGSWPELRATVRPRGESVHIGPCRSDRRCEGTIDAARLAPGVPFRVAVDEIDGFLADRVGAAWLVWHGEREETLRTRLEGVDVTVTVKRRSVQPPAAVALPAPRPPASTRDAGAPRANAPRPRPRPRRDAGTPKEQLLLDPPPPW